jgi:hypothetical protein
MQMDMDIEMDMTVKIGGTTISQSMAGNIKIIVEDGKMKTATVMDMGMMGTTEVIYDGENLYFAMNGMELDLSSLGIDIDEFLSEAAVTSVDMPEFGPDAIKSIETGLVSGGEKTTIIIDGAELSAFSMESMGGMADILEEFGDTDIPDIIFGDVLIEFIVDNGGQPKSMRIQMTMDVEAEGESAFMEMDMTYTVNAIGSGVVIEFPGAA